MRKAFSVSLVLFILMVIFSTWLYPALPEEVAIHWNIDGVADGFAGKIWAAALLPLVSLGILGLLAVIPRIDPLKKNFPKFLIYYEGMVIAFTSFMLYIHVITLALNVGYSFNIISAMSPAFAGLFYYIGILIGKTKKNWFVGIRTPWTLSSDRVWEKTNRLGGRLFRGAGIITLLGLVFPGYAILLLIGPAIAAAVYSVVFSYFEYQKEARQKAHGTPAKGSKR